MKNDDGVSEITATDDPHIVDIEQRYWVEPSVKYQHDRSEAAAAVRAIEELRLVARVVRFIWMWHHRLSTGVYIPHPQACTNKGACRCNDGIDISFGCASKKIEWELRHLDGLHRACADFRFIDKIVRVNQIIVLNVVRDPQNALEVFEWRNCGPIGLLKPSFAFDRIKNWVNIHER